MTIGNELAIVAILISIIIPLCKDLVYPRYIKPKPTVKLTHTPHWTSVEKDIALHDHTITNEGNAPAKALGLNFEINPKFKIKSVACDRPWDKKTGGKGHYSVELLWDELPPKKSFHVLIYTETSPLEEDLYPMSYKAWYKDKLVDKYGQ